MNLDNSLNFEQEAQGVIPGATTTNHQEGFAALIGSILSIVMVIALLLLLFYLISGALQWITAGGDSSKLTEARNKMMYAVVGMLILSASLALFMFVQYILGIEILVFTFGGPGGGS